MPERSADLRARDAALRHIAGRANSCQPSAGAWRGRAEPVERGAEGLSLAARGIDPRASAERALRGGSAPARRRDRDHAYAGARR